MLYAYRVYDIFPALQKLHNEYAVKKYCCDLPFDSYITENLFKNKKYLFSLNYGMFEKEVRPYYNLSYFALKNDIKMSYFGYSYISPHLNNDFVIYRLYFPEKDDLFVFNMDEYYNETTGDFDAEKAITYDSTI